MKKILIIIMIFVLSGCASAPYRANRNFESYFDNHKAVAIMPPDMKISKLTAGGVSELVDEWSEDANAKVAKVIKEELSSFRSMSVNALQKDALPENDKNFLKEQEGLYNAVSYSIINHTYSPESIFKHKINNFDYSLGSEILRLSDITQNDTFLFTTGNNYLWTGGRIALSAFSLLVGVATGVHYIVPAGPEWFTASLVDAKTGDVIWFNYVPSPGDLRNEDVDRAVVKRIFSDFPQKWR